MGAAEEIADFAALLRELKERSGLSYESLAKRAHMSTSTLHRYCKGEGVPADNAAVARFARVCKANPEELNELHRRWALANAARERASRAADAEVAAVDGAGTSMSGSAPEPCPAQAPTGEVRPEAVPDDPPALTLGDPAVSVAEPSPKAVISGNGTPVRTRTARKRWGLIAAGTAAAVAVSIAITVNPKEKETDTTQSGRPAGAMASSGQRSSDSASTHPPTSAPVSPSVSPSRAANPTAPDAKKSSHSAAPAGTQDSDEARLTVTTRTYAWDDPQCEAKYLINRPPTDVSPPPMGQDVPGWVKAHRAIAADRQRVALTVQGTGDEAVVIESMHVRVTGSGAPPAWNTYRGSSGCGGNVQTRSFDTDLDAARPVFVPKAGQRGFPYKVSQSDPEVLYITAHASARDVTWYVELQWSSGGRQGTIRIDDHGRPFRTSGSKGRVYEYPIGGTEWNDVTGQ